MMEQMAVPSRERSLYSMVEHLLSLDETAWYLYALSLIHIYHGHRTHEGI